MFQLNVRLTVVTRMYFSVQHERPTMRDNRMICGKLRSICTKLFEPFKEAIERPTPIIFMSGEGLCSSVWNQSMEYVSSLGYGGAAIEFPHFAENIDQAVSTLHNSLAPISFQPPVLIAHSMSTFVAQKYLESYALSALILVNPLPPKPSISIAKLLKKWSNVREIFPSSLSTQQLETIIVNYYGLKNNQRLNAMEHQQLVSHGLCGSRSSAESLFSDNLEYSMPASVNFLNSLVDDESTVLTLEPRSVPIFIVMTALDRDIIEKSGESQLMENHEIEEDGIIVFEEDKSRLPMLQSSDKFNPLIGKWIEMVS